MDSDVLIILVLSILSFTLTSLLLFTIYRYRSRIPRQSVVTALLWTTLPRIIILLLPLLMRTQLQVGLPFNWADRRADQQTSPLGKWCAAQALLVNYFLSANAIFTFSFTLSLLHVVFRPYPRSTSPSRSFNYWSLSLALLPLVFALPIPLLGLSFILNTSPSKKKIIYFQGTYCNINARAFQITCGSLAGVPLVISFIMIVVAGIRVWQVRRDVRKSRRKHKGGREKEVIRAFQTVTNSTGNWEDKETVSNAGHSNESGDSGTRVDPINTQIPNPTSPYSPSLDSPEASRPASNLHFRLTTRLIFLALEIAISAILFLLQISLDDQALFTTLNIDKYWEAIAPLIQFAIFASQTAVLEVWFPMWFGNKESLYPLRPSMEAKGNGQAFGPAPPVDNRGIREHGWRLSVSSGPSSFSDVSLDSLHGVKSAFEETEGQSRLDEVDKFQPDLELGGMDNGYRGGRRAPDLPAIAGPSQSRSIIGLPSTIDPAAGHLSLQEDDDIMREGEMVAGAEENQHEPENEWEDEQAEHSPEKPILPSPSIRSERTSSSGRRAVARARSAKSSTDRYVEIEPEGLDGRHKPRSLRISLDRSERPSIKTRRSRRLDPAIPTFLKRGPGRLPDR